MDHEAAIEALSPHPNRVEAFQATLTEAQLEALKDEVWSQVDHLIEVERIDVREVGVNVARNAVEIGLPVPNPIDEQRLRERFGPNVRVIQSAPVRTAKNNKKKKQQGNNPKRQARERGSRAGRNGRARHGGAKNGRRGSDGKKRRRGQKKSSRAQGGGRAQSAAEPNARVSTPVPPLTGGLAIRDGKTKQVCTSGYSISRGPVGKRTYSVLTAGHCTREGSTLKRGQASVGKTLTNLNGSDTAADVAEIRISPGMSSGHVLVNDVEGRLYLSGVGDHVSIADQYQGQPACVAGSSQQAMRCGTLETPQTFVVLPDDARLHHQGKIANIGAVPGDSGGPVFTGGPPHRPLGILSLSSTQTPDPTDDQTSERLGAAYFSQMELVINRLSRPGSPARPLKDRAEPAHFGFNDDWHPGNFTAWPSGSAPYTANQDIGADTARFSFDWRDLVTVERDGEGNPTSCNFKLPALWPPRYDQTYSAMLAAGMRPLIILQGAPECFTQTTTCPNTSPNASPPDDTDEAEAAWQQFVRAAVQHFPQALGFEIWNEPNNWKFWGGCETDDPVEARQPNPARYVELLRLANEEIERVEEEANPDRTITVVSAGLWSNRPLPPEQPGQEDNSTRAYRWQKYLGRFFQADGAASADVIGLHPYRSQEDNSQDRDFALSIYSQIHEARSIRGQITDPFWVTEVGVSAAVDTGPSSVDGEAEQAKKLATVYTKLRELGLPMVVIHRLVNTTGGANLWSDNIGVLTSSFAKKPAYCSLAAVRGYSLCP